MTEYFTTVFFVISLKHLFVDNVLTGMFKYNAKFPVYNKCLHCFSEALKTLP